MYKIMCLGLMGLLFSACKPRLDQSELADDSASSAEIRLGGPLNGIMVPAAKPGVWAFGARPSGPLAYWPDPVGHQPLAKGRYSWPTNWPMSPVGAMPYEKLYSHKRSLQGGEQITVGDEDYHFDCDDFALSYHRWCAFNAGKKCLSVRVGALDAGEIQTMRLKVEFSEDGSFKATGVEDESPAAWATKFLGVYNPPPVEATYGDEIFAAQLRYNGELYHYINWSAKFDGYSFRRRVACDSKTKHCSYVISYRPNRPFIDVSYVRHEEIDYHVMVAHELKGNDNMRRYCLAEYYFWPEFDNDLPYLYGCWAQDARENALKFPDYIAQSIRFAYSGHSDHQVESIYAQPVHSQVQHEMTFTKQKVRGDEIQIGELSATKNVQDINEPEYNKLKTTGFIFSYLTGLDPHTLEPLTEQEIRRRHLDNPRALEVYFTLSGQFPMARKAENDDPYRDDSNFNARDFSAIKRNLLQFQLEGRLSK